MRSGLNLALIMATRSAERTFADLMRVFVTWWVTKTALTVSLRVRGSVRCSTQEKRAPRCQSDFAYLSTSRSR